MVLSYVIGNVSVRYEMLVLWYPKMITLIILLLYLIHYKVSMNDKVHNIFMHKINKFTRKSKIWIKIGPKS